MKRKDKAGYTLLEVTISFGLLLILITLSAGLSRYFLQASETIQVRAELFHQASVSMEFIAAHVDTAYRFSSIDNHTIHFDRRRANGTIDSTHIQFSPHTDFSGRLYIGGLGNEVSRYLQMFSFEEDNGLLYVNLTTTKTITGSTTVVEPVQLTRVFDISTKFSTEH